MKKFFVFITVLVFAAVLVSAAWCDETETEPIELPTATESFDYYYSLTDTGNNITWSIVSGDLPLGLELSRDTGIIYGIPETGTAGQYYYFTVKAQSGEKSVEVDYYLWVNSSGAYTVDIANDMADKSAYVKVGPVEAGGSCNTGLGCVSMFLMPVILLRKRNRKV